MMRPTANRRVHAYTLIELLAAMAVLTIMMGFLFKFVHTAQRAWSLTESNTRLYQNAQIAFDLIAHDLRAAVASDFQDAEIPFWINGSYNSATWPEQDAICFVAAIEARNEDSETRMVEVRYSLFTDESDNDPVHEKQLYWLRRSLTSDKVTGPPVANDVKWDFYGVFKGKKNASGVIIDEDWVGTGQNRHHIIDGVEEFAVQAYPSTTGTQNELPAAVQVKLTLIDPEATKANVPAALQTLIKNRSRRTFTKVIFLGGQ